ncbi:MAG: nucleotide exchange factor GrpE [Prevotella sp.]|jgi:molecular chaperone GrpE|nr:nucleotide exchange factor GrpE [Prevotella sp.]MCI1281002.1 nucleotide exchange factor GrpE [Prevotella sp.]
MSKKDKKIDIEDGNKEQQQEEQTSAKEVEETAADTKAEEKTDEKSEPTDKKDPIEELNAQIADLKDKYLRIAAEFDNFKKRTLKEKAELIINGGEKTISAILPVLDDMERAIANADKADSKEKLEEGWELISKKFESILESLGVKKIDTKDADFNVDYHEAIAMVPGMGDDKKGKVVDCVQTGYMMNDKVIRHAKVAVGQ